MKPDPRKKLKIGKAVKSPITQETLKEDRQRAADAPGTFSVGNYSTRGYYYGGPAPRIGGTVKKSTPLRGGTKKQVKAAKKIVSKSLGKGASRSAKRTYR